MNRRAVTLIELLVVIAVISVLLALGMAGIQAARDAARRTACAANLGEMGKALQGYEAAHREFPPGITPERDGARKIGRKFHSFQSRLLPFLDQLQAYEQIDFKMSIPQWWMPGLVKLPGASHGRVATFLCPADEVPEAWPGNSYRGSTGATAYLFPEGESGTGGAVAGKSPRKRGS
jgi:prepilin-type N-terminal cleavage/methylation domain-containing protein